MFGSAILDVTIGLVFIFCLVSVICTSLREGLEAVLKTRAAYLERGIRELLQDKDATGLARAVFEHPLIFGLYSSTSYKPGGTSKLPQVLAIGRGLPSYIPTRNFALALMDIAARGRHTDDANSHPNGPVLDLHTVRTNVLNLGSPQVQRVLLTAIDTAQNDFDVARAAIEQWYDGSMDRVSGWYKRSTQWIIFWIGLFIAVALNVNTIDIAEFLYRNEAVREAVVARAESAAAEGRLANEGFSNARTELEGLGLPIGWGQQKTQSKPEVDTWSKYVAPGFGWLLTAVAATLGAPFWFDLLNKFVVIRSTVKPHEKSPEEASEDRQLPPAAKPMLLTDVRDPGRHVPAPQAGMGIGAVGAVPAPYDDDIALDSCDVEFDETTPDEDLPAAQGGVA